MIKFLSNPKNLVILIRNLTKSKTKKKSLYLKLQTIDLLFELLDLQKLENQFKEPS